MKTFCLALDLKNDPELIAEYKRYHEPGSIWPEVVEGIKNHGILSEEIFLLGNHMVMVLRTEDSFTFEAKEAADSTNPVVQDWERLMWKFQQPLAEAKPGQKWVPMEKIFEVK